MATSTKTTFHSYTGLQEYGWRAFCIELLYGIIVITWYLLFLAEKTMLRGLTRLETFSTSPRDSPSGYERATNVLFQDEGF